MLYYYTTTGLASTSLFGCHLVILEEDSWVNRLVYIHREIFNCTEELNWILGYPRCFGLLIRITLHFIQHDAHQTFE